MRWFRELPSPQRGPGHPLELHFLGPCEDLGKDSCHVLSDLAIEVNTPMTWAAFPTGWTRWRLKLLVSLVLGWEQQEAVAALPQAAASTPSGPAMGGRSRRAALGRVPGALHYGLYPQPPFPSEQALPRNSPPPEQPELQQRWWGVLGTKALWAQGRSAHLSRLPQDGS